MTRCRRALQYLSDVWFATQVELQGHYSVEHLQRLQHYHETTSWRRAVLVCLLTPLPCIAIVLLLDTIPVEAPENGAWSPRLWTRTFVTIFLCAVAFILQFRQHIHELSLPMRRILFIAAVATVTSVGLTFLTSALVAHPLPFAMVYGTVPWFLAILSCLLWFHRAALRSSPALLRNLVRYHAVVVCQITITVVYPLYNHVYSRLAPLQQTAFILLLPVLKIVGKNWISRWLPDSDDAKPEAIIFNIEIFHALFVALTMQQTTSLRTIAVLMAIDLLHAWISFLDVAELLRLLRPLVAKLRHNRHESATHMSRRRPDAREMGGLYRLLERVSRLVELEPEHLTAVSASFDRPAHWISRLSNRALVQVSPAVAGGPRANEARVAGPLTEVVLQSMRDCEPHTSKQEEETRGSGAVQPMARPGLHELDSVSVVSLGLQSLTVSERGQLVRKTLQLLFITEFIALVEYTEVIMPVIYNACLIGFFYQPNRQYYPFLAGLSASDLLPTAGSILLYSSLELASLVIMSVLLWWRLRLSLVHQLAFVLETRHVNVQAKLLLWVIYIIQNTIVQLGADYSFQFKWLRHGNATEA
ncbi:hypothetical protein ATCC90586_008001 [Pythium insidiosum]|nr:hypothetical protein ATCC90586_008001 [Pythium insidiosum]